MMNVENMSKNLIISASELLQKNLIIPEYQRAYTWGEKNISKMIEDFEEFLKQDNKNLKYYLGTILLHEDGNKFNIIDGQQRITTLLLMLKIYEHTSFDIKYGNPKSQIRIKENYHYLDEILKSKETKESIRRIFEKIVFTVITTKNVDDAFTFFDTQNNRGVKPSVLVLLKSFNLRAIKGKIETQISCAEKWEYHEKIQHGKEYSLLEQSEKLEWLIKIFFYRVRNWRGNERADFGSYDRYRDSFTKDLRESTNNEYKKYPSFMNKIVLSNDMSVITQPRNHNWFEFAIRQPIFAGEGFFMFVDYYAKQLDELMKIKVYQNKTFNELVEIHKTGSRFLASFLTVVTLVYYDRFGEDNMFDFIKKLDILLANIRLEKDRILKQTTDIYFIRCVEKYVKYNILDFICGAFDTKEVIDWMGDVSIGNYKNNDKNSVQGRFSKQHENFWS